MSMLFFDVFDGERHVKDEFGVQLNDRSEIPEQAVATAHSLLTDSAPGHGSRSVIVSVRNEEGRIIYTANASSIGSWTEMLP